MATSLEISFLIISLRQIISASAIFSPNKSVLGADDQSNGDVSDDLG